MWWGAWRARRAARSNYRSLLTATVHDKTDLVRAQKRLTELETEANLTDETRAALLAEAASQLIERTGGDSLSEEHESELETYLTALGISADLIRGHMNAFADFVARLLVVRANAGRLTVVNAPGIILKEGEVAYLEVQADLMKEVRNTTRVYSGVSFRLVKGVYYHMGTSQVGSVSTSLQPVDRGKLTVTSKRVVYTGSQQSREIAHSKIMAVNTYDDGIQFNLSNRQNAPLFQMSKGFGHVVAATLNAAMHHEQISISSPRLRSIS